MSFNYFIGKEIAECVKIMEGTKNLRILSVLMVILEQIITSNFKDLNVNLKLTVR